MPFNRRQFLQHIAVAATFHAASPRSWPDQATLRFWVMGDRTGGAVQGVYERTIGLIVAEQPQFVINVGDSIEGLRDFWTDIEWLEMKKLWRHYGDIPHYCTAGNHDIWLANSQRLYTQFTGFAPHYSFTRGYCHVTVLDNIRTELPGEDQVEFLRADLKAHGDIPLKLVFLHKPFWIPYLMLKSGEFSLHRACREYGVHWVFSGHLHHLWHLTRDGVHYVSMGSRSGSITRGKRLGQGFSHGWFHHYGLAEVTTAGFSLQIQELPAPYGDQRRLLIDEWHENRPVSAGENAAAWRAQRIEPVIARASANRFPGG